MDTKDTKLQDALKNANSEVEKAEINDPELKKIAFSKAVDFYLHGEKESSQSYPAMEEMSDVKKSNFWNSLTTSTSIEEGKLKDVYSVKEKQILLVISSVSGESRADQQRNLAILILFAYHEGLGYEWVSSGLLAQAAKHSKLYDTSKFAKNLRSKETNWFSMKGAKKGLAYKLSGPGLNQAKSLLVEITNEND